MKGNLLIIPMLRRVSEEFIESIIDVVQSAINSYYREGEIDVRDIIMEAVAGPAFRKMGSTLPKSNVKNNRWLDTRLGRTNKPDRQKAKYPWISPYSYAANNPILYKDPDGETIKIYYKDDKGNNKFYEYGSKIDVPNNEFVQKSVAALDHLSKNEFANNIITKLATDQTNHVNLQRGSGTEADGFTFSRKNGTLFDDRIEWDPSGGLKTTNGDNISPSTALFHEVVHNYSALYDFNTYWTRANTFDAQYGDKEERFAIKYFENNVADFFGEAQRADHKGTPIVTESVTSNRESVVPMDSEIAGKKEVVLNE